MKENATGFCLTFPKIVFIYLCWNVALTYLDVPYSQRIDKCFQSQSFGRGEGVSKELFDVLSRLVNLKPSICLRDGSSMHCRELLTLNHVL